MKPENKALERVSFIAAIIVALYGIALYVTLRAAPAASLEVIFAGPLEPGDYYPPDYEGD